MNDAALNLYQRLNTYDDIERLIADGETEGLYLECKSPSGPSFNKGLQGQVAKALSGFGNSEGGVLIFGVVTTPHPPSGRDILTQLSPVAKIAAFMRNVHSHIPELTTPHLLGATSKTLTKNLKDAQGIGLLYIPNHVGDPLRTVSDAQQFYIRIVDEHQILTYNLIQRMFASIQGPDLSVFVDTDLSLQQDDNKWKIVLTVINNSSRVARDMCLQVVPMSMENCSVTPSDELIDQSHLYPNMMVFSTSPVTVVYKNMRRVLGHLTVTPEADGLPMKVEIVSALFADHMQARQTIIPLTMDPDLSLGDITITLIK